MEDEEYRLAEPEVITPPVDDMPPQRPLYSGPAQPAVSKEALLEALRSEQNLVMGIWGGAMGAVLGAAAWGIISAVSGYQIGLVAIGVGFLAGYAVRYFGRGVDKQFGIIGAAWAVIGCMLGNLLSICIWVSQATGAPLLELLAGLPRFAVPALIETFSLMDVLFYGIALYEGYRFSFRELTHADIQRLTAKAAANSLVSTSGTDYPETEN